MAHKFMSSPLRVLVKRNELTLEVRVARPAHLTHPPVPRWPRRTPVVLES